MVKQNLKWFIIFYSVAGLNDVFIKFLFSGFDHV